MLYKGSWLGIYRYSLFQRSRLNSFVQGGPLRSCAIAARMLSLMWKKPLVAVNHCVAHIEVASHISMSFDLMISLSLDGSSGDPLQQSSGAVCVWREHASHRLQRQEVPHLRRNHRYRSGQLLGSLRTSVGPL